MMNSHEREHIQEVLNNPASKTEDILEVESCIFFFSQSMLPVVQFLIENAEPLIRAAISSERKVIQDRAYRILTSDNSILREVALGRGLIADVFAQFLDAEPVDRVVLARMASIMELCLADLFDDACAQFWSITRLVKYFDVSAVVDLFKDLVQHPRTGPGFVSWLCSLEIDGYLMTEIEDLHRRPPEELNYEYIVGLYEVLDALLKDPEMLSHFMSPNRISMLVAPFDGAPHFVCSGHCQLLFDIMNDHTAPFIAQEIPRFTKLLQDEGPVLTCDAVWAMKIMVKMLSVAAQQTRGFDIDVLVNAAFRILSNFPEHSIGLSEACSCLLFLAQQQDMRDEILDRFVMVAQYSFESNQSRTMVCWCYRLMTDMEQKIDFTGYDKADFDSVYAEYVAPRESAINAPYGGPMPTGFNFFGAIQI